MKIIHLNDFGGISSVLAQQQREKGYEVNIIRCENLGPIHWNGWVIKHYAQLQKADIIHVHGGIRLSHLALRPWKGKIIAHFHGSDARLGTANHHLNWASAYIVSTPDLLENIPDAHWIPNPLHITLPSGYHFSDNSEQIFIGHFPTNPEIKGTAIIQKAIMGLPEITLCVFYNLPHDKALSSMKNCDFVIDQVNEIGTYGLVTLEAWALGKPVICSIRRDLYPYEVPVLETNPEVDSIRAAIYWLVQNRYEWKELAKLGRDFLHKHHNLETITEKYEKIYREIMENPQTR